MSAYSTAAATTNDLILLSLFHIILLHIKDNDFIGSMLYSVVSYLALHNVCEIDQSLGTLLSKLLLFGDKEQSQGLK
jgi:hypothetical protein